MKKTLIALILMLSTIFSFSQEAKLVTQQRIRSTITDFKFSPGGGYLANISEGDPSINVWHLASEKIIGTLQEYDEEVVEFSFNSSGDELVSLHKDQLLIRWDLNSWSLKDSSRLDYLPDWIEFSSKNVFIGRAGEVKVLDKQLHSVKEIKVKGTPSSSFVDQEYVWIGTDAGELTKFNANSLSVEVQEKFKNTDFASFDVSKKKDRIVVMNKDGSVSTILKSALSLVETIEPLSGINFGNQYGVVHADAGYIAYISEKNQVDCYNLEGNLLFQLVDTVEA